MIAKAIKYFLFLILVSVFWIPLFLKHFPIIKEVKLEGYFEIPDSAFILSDTNWLNGNFQEKYQKWYNYNMGLHRTGVRLSNQLNYYTKEQPPNVVIAKEDELMGQEYIEAYLGKDFIGVDSVERECVRMRQLKDTLDKHRIRFFVVIAPNKSRVRANLIPDFFHPEIRMPGNYEYYLKGFNKHGIPVVNFEKWFETKHDTSRYPLFCNLGIHWSNYGAMLCADSLFNYIERTLDKPINHVWLRDIIVSNKPERTDDDLMKVMNLLIPLKPREKLANFWWDLPIDSGKTRPDVMAIGDSFYWNIINFGMTKYFSDSSVFLYYNSEVFYYKGDPKFVDKIDLKKEILSKKIIFMLYSEPNLRHSWNGFTEKALVALSK